MPERPHSIHGPRGKSPGLHQAIHLRISAAESARLEAHARRLALARNTRVTLSEAVRDLLEQALARQDEQPWESALKSLPFVAWTGGKPELPSLDEEPDGTDLARIVLEDRGGL
ncbi:MAG: hypothetical protein ABSH53_14835 [Holophaga sp.]|jgi:hypothetical protein